MYVPPDVFTNDMMARMMDTTDEWVIQRTGIRERRFAPAGTGSAQLGVEAARAALANANLLPSDIDLVIFATMKPSTHALDIRMQCAGFLSGLQTADAFIRSGMADRILLVGAECHSGLMPWPQSVWDVVEGKSEGPCDPAWYAIASGMRDRAVLFGDGAGAMILEANDSGDGRGFLGFVMYTDGTHWDKLHVPGGGCKSRPYFTPEMFENLETIPIVEGRQVFRLAVQLMPAAVREVLSRHGRSLDE